MGGTLFTGDLHLGHRMVAGLRGFEDPAEHDDELAARWDAVVRPGDRVWLLGDITLGKPEIALAWVRERPGIKHLIVGNHDAIHPMHRDSHKRLIKENWGSTFASIQMAARRRIEGREVLLSHFPYPAAGDGEGRSPSGEGRHNQWRLPDCGLPLIHGHTHSSGRLGTDGRSVHVGLDAWGLAPVSLVQVAELLGCR